jgi:hypothetical protein
MADITGNGVLGVERRFRDMGDDTYAEVVSGASYSAEVTISRPENTTAYTAGDVIGVAAAIAANAGSAIHELTNIGPAGGRIWITAADWMDYVASVPAGKTSMRMHIYDASPTAILDNAAWSLLAADRTKYKGYIDLGSPAAMGVTPTTLFVEAEQINKPIKLAAGSTSLFVQIVTNGGYTPGSADVAKLAVHSAAA